MFDRLKAISSKFKQKISLLVCENSSLDDGIKSIIATDSAEFFQGLNAFTVGMEGTSANTRVWIPILGLNEETALQKIADFLHPDETCPVFPFPAANARREEKIVCWHGKELFRGLGDWLTAIFLWYFLKQFTHTWEMLSVKRIEKFLQEMQTISVRSCQYTGARRRLKSPDGIAFLNHYFNCDISQFAENKIEKGNYVCKNCLNSL